VRLSQVHVDGTGVDRRVRALGLDSADHLAARIVDDAERVDRRRSQRDAPRREAVAARQVAPAALAQLAETDETLGVALPSRPEDVAILRAQRQLVSSGGEVRQMNALRLVVEDRALDGAVEELVRMAAEELIERVVARDIQSEAGPAPTRAPPHLAQARDGTWEGDADR